MWSAVPHTECDIPILTAYESTSIILQRCGRSPAGCATAIACAIVILALFLDVGQTRAYSQLKGVRIGEAANPGPADDCGDREGYGSASESEDDMLLAHMFRPEELCEDDAAEEHWARQQYISDCESGDDDGFGLAFDWERDDFGGMDLPDDFGDCFDAPPSEDEQPEPGTHSNDAPHGYTHDAPTAANNTSDHGDDTAAVITDNSPMRPPAPSNDPDPWPEHPAGPQGAWLRMAAQRSWQGLSKMARLDLFNPPAYKRHSTHAAARDKGKSSAERQTDELRAELEHNAPPFAPQKSFGGAFIGYFFSTCDGKTGYYADKNGSDPDGGNDGQKLEQHSAAPTTPVTISLDAHTTPGNGGRGIPQRSQLRQHASPQREHGPQRRRRNRSKFVGPLLPPSRRTLAEDDSWKDLGLIAVDTANGNSFASTEFLRAKSAADAMLVQETKVLGHATDEIHKNARKHGWRAVATPALKCSGNSASSGTAVLVRSNFGLREAPGSEILYEPHRSCMAEATMLDGIYLVSAYLRHSEGASPDNQRILAEIAANLATANGKWLLAMDANMTPESLHQTGWLELVDGVIHHCDQATCGRNNYDYFVASASVSRTVHGVQKITDGGINPHSAVRILLKDGNIRRRRRALKRPPKVPGILPLGPQPQTIHDWQERDAPPPPATTSGAPVPTRQRWNKTTNYCTEASNGTSPAQAKVDEDATSWVREARRYWSAITGNDLGDDDRASLVWTPLLRPPQQPGNDLMHAAHWRSTGKALAEIAAWARNHTATAQLIPLWTAIHDHTGRQDGLHEATAEQIKESADWVEMARQLAGEAAVKGSMAPADAARLSARALKVANLAEKRHRESAKQQIRDYFDAGSSYCQIRDVKMPGTNAFRMIREPTGWAKAGVGSSTYNSAAPRDDQCCDEGANSRHWDETQPAPSSPRLLSDQGDIESTADGWAALWQEGKHPFLPPSGHLPSDLPLLDAQAIKDAALSFPANTGVGADNTAPRAVAALPVAIRQRLADLLNECERVGTWPSRWQIVLICLLPKADGGRRPIGLFPSVIRIWMRARASALRRWESEQDHPAIFGSAGKAATRATWVSAWEAESAKNRGCLYAQALLDLAKAFETVPHEALWNLAAARGYPLTVLRLALAAYRMPRTIGADGVYSRLVHATRGITAGSGTATAELRLLVLQLLDVLGVECPRITAAVYVDDINLEASHTVDEAHAPPSASVAEHRHMCATSLAADIAHAINCVVRFFEDGMGMEVSASKSVITATMPALARMTEAMVIRGKATAVSGGAGTYGKMLGVATTGGGTRIMKVHNKRTAAVKKRIWRFRNMGKRGFCRTALARATIVPSACYGIETTGASDSTLRRLRRIALSAVATSTHGGNLDAEWMARDGSHSSLDPAFRMHVAPLAFLAAAWWNGWRTHDQLCDAIACARAKINAPLKPRASVWMRAVGPSAAALLTAARLGWTISDTGAIRTDDGETLQLGVDPPAAVQHAVEQSVRRWRSANVLYHEMATRHLLTCPDRALAPDVIPAMSSQWHRAAANTLLQPHLDDFSALLKTRKSLPAEGWQNRYGPYLLSATANKQWTQARVAAVRHPDWDSDARCQLCLQECGTLPHRHCCPKIREMVGDAGASIDLSGINQPMTTEQAVLWQTRGIGAFRRSVEATQQQEWFQWILPLHDRWDESKLSWYIDASQIDAKFEETTRFGYGMIAVDDLGRLAAAAVGTPPSYVRTIAQAEAHALAMVLSQTAQCKEIITDCQSNLTVLRSGFKAATDGRRRAARTWRTIEATTDGDADAVPLRWTPAHKSWSSIREARFACNSRDEIASCMQRELDWQCNRAVDHLAKMAASTCRTSWQHRAWLARTQRFSRNTRSRLGAVTWASQSVVVQKVNDDGEVYECTTRDSTGRPAGNAPKGKENLDMKRKRDKQSADEDDADAHAVPRCARRDTPKVQRTDKPSWEAISEVNDDLLRACRATGRGNRGSCDGLAKAADANSNANKRSDVTEHLASSTPRTPNTRACSQRMKASYKRKHPSVSDARRSASRCPAQAVVTSVGPQRSSNTDDAASAKRRASVAAQLAASLHDDAAVGDTTTPRVRVPSLPNEIQHKMACLVDSIADRLLSSRGSCSSNVDADMSTLEKALATLGVCSHDDTQAQPGEVSNQPAHVSRVQFLRALKEQCRHPAPRDARAKKAVAHGNCMNNAMQAQRSQMRTPVHVAHRPKTNLSAAASVKSCDAIARLLGSDSSSKSPAGLQRHNSTSQPAAPPGAARRAVTAWEAGGT